jgi:hypothetical protein
MTNPSTRRRVALAGLSLSGAKLAACLKGATNLKPKGSVETEEFYVFFLILLASPTQ